MGPLLRRRVRLLASSWLRATRWEYWPPWLFYLPVAAQIGALAIKHRGLTVFTAANPGILAGGVIGESKHGILEALGQAPDRIARSALMRGGLSIAEKRAEVRRFLQAEQLELPVVLKPNEGQRGSGVVVARTAEELDAYLERCIVDTIVQEFVPGLEFGVFYYRRPSEAAGHLLSITEKRLPTVIGDGRRTLEQLLLDDPGTVGMARFHLRRHRGRLHVVPAAGEVVPLGDLGTHCRGARFLDGRAVWTPALEQAFDEISRRFDGFHFGRFDVRVSSIEEFRRGRGFKVIELNGVTSEATHIYDPCTGLREAYRVLFEQWRLAFEIAAENLRRGAAATSTRTLLQLALRYRRMSKDHLQATLR